jgi:hypothetical protein
VPRHLAGRATRSPMLTVLRKELRKESPQKNLGPGAGHPRWPQARWPQEPDERCIRRDRQTLSGPCRARLIDSTPNVNHASEMAFFPPLAEGAPCVAASMRF